MKKALQRLGLLTLIGGFGLEVGAFRTATMVTTAEAASFERVLKATPVAQGVLEDQTNCRKCLLGCQTELKKGAQKAGQLMEFTFTKLQELQLDGAMLHGILQEGFLLGSTTAYLLQNPKLAELFQTWATREGELAERAKQMVAIAESALQLGKYSTKILEGVTDADVKKTLATAFMYIATSAKTLDTDTFFYRKPDGTCCLRLTAPANLKDAIPDAVTLGSLNALASLRMATDEEKASSQGSKTTIDGWIRDLDAATVTGVSRGDKDLLGLLINWSYPLGQVEVQAKTGTLFFHPWGNLHLTFLTVQFPNAMDYIPQIEPSSSGVAPIPETTLPISEGSAVPPVEEQPAAGAEGSATGANGSEIAPAPGESAI